MNQSQMAQLDALINKVSFAQEQFAQYTQEKVDTIFKKVALAANEQRIHLAKIAVKETKMGLVEDKVIKNHFASELIYNKYKNEATCGVIESDPHFGFRKIAEPVGVLAGVVPVTNPTSTTIFKTLISLKTRNGIIFSPHPKATKCTIETAKILLEAAVKAGAPAGIIGWIEDPTLDLSKALMQHPKIGLIVATGGPGMVKSAYSSGRPSMGVGAGNTPAVIDETADIKQAVSSILLSKTFDNGMICASEQSVIVASTVYEQVKNEFILRGAYFLNPKEKEKVKNILTDRGHINVKIVGQSVQTIANLAGINVPEKAKVLIAEIEEVGLSEPFSIEKLSPVLAFYKAKDFLAATHKAEELVAFAGKGHTSVLYTNPANQQRIDFFDSHVSTGRVLINSPASQGAIGDMYNFKLDPSLTLGCGTWGGNSISENLTAHHLLNIKTVSERRENMLWFRVPPKVYFKAGCLPIALKDLREKKRAFIITDKPIFELGMVKEVTDVLESLKIEHETFYDVIPDPDLKTVNKGLRRIREFQPDVIIAFGGGSPVDAAKIIWLMYEHPEVDFAGMAARFFDIRKRVYDLPQLGDKAQLVAIPTTSGTGSEVTPFAVVTDEQTGRKYPLADYTLTPSMAIIDPDLVLNLPKKLTAYSGIDALTHAIEAYVSVLASNFTDGSALKAISMLFKYLPRAYRLGSKDPQARENVHYAATIAGFAFANSFLGICHSLAHQLGAEFDIPHGLANALMISHVIRFNSTDAPFKQTAFSQYEYPLAKERYGEIADHLGLGGDSPEEKVENLIAAIEDLKAELDIPICISDAIPGNEQQFLQRVEALADQAFDDQCTGANPRYPLISELKDLYLRAYNAPNDQTMDKTIQTPPMKLAHSLKSVKA